MPNPIGRKLNLEWGVGARHALYRKDGRWYHHLQKFPGALFDEHGYVLFDSKEAYEACPQLNHGAELNVDGGISSILGYVKVR